MAAFILSEPGSQYGACKESCEHSGCQAMREQANENCSICNKPIGYGLRYFRDNNGLSHAICLEELYESKE